jgi:DNA-binding IclR family transcriptional regulator
VSTESDKPASADGGERRSPVTKAIQMLAWMADSGEQSWGIRQAARGLDVPPSTAHRTFAMLESAGALVSDENGRYRFSLDLIRLASRIGLDLPLRRAALPHMAELVEQTGETIYLGVYGDERKRLMYVDRVESHHPLRYVLPMYEWLPMHAGAGGEAILAFLPEADIERILSADDLQVLTEKTVTDPDQLRRELQQIRREGYIETRGRLLEGTVGMAAPVFGPDDQVVGCIVVALPEIRLDPSDSESLGTKLRACADSVSADLGGTRPSAAGEVALSGGRS